MRKRQVWLIVLACWIGVLVLIGAAYAVVELWVLDDGLATTSPYAQSTDAVASVELTPGPENTDAELLFPTSTPQTTDATPAPELTTEPMDTATPTDTPAPTNTLRPTVSPVPSQTDAPESSQTDVPAPTGSVVPKTQRGPKPTDTPKPESFRLYFKKLDDGSMQVFHKSSVTDEIVPVFAPDRGRKAHSAAWSPGGEHVLTVAEWKTSSIDFGERLRLDNRDGSGGYDVLYVPAYNVGGAEQARDMGNAIWSPDGQTIAMWYLDGPNDGVYVINSDGTEHRRLDNSQPGDWPRWWSVDGEWIVVINDNGGLFALDVGETRRVPWDTLEEVHLYDQRYFPWRITGDPKCNKDQIVTSRSWWNCK